jgi:hypothetical protein
MMDINDLLKLLPLGSENRDELAGRLRILLKHILDKLESHEQILVTKGVKMKESELQEQQAQQITDDMKAKQLEEMQPEDLVRYRGAEPLLAMEKSAGGRAAGESSPALTADEEIQQTRDVEAELQTRAREKSEESLKKQGEAQELKSSATAPKAKEEAPESLDSDEQFDEPAAEEEEAEVVEEEQPAKKGKKGGLFGSSSSKRK